MSKSEIEFSAENAQKLGNLISRSALLEELSKGTIITDALYGMGIMAGNNLFRPET